MTTTEKIWKILSEWDTTSSHFKYIYVIINDCEDNLKGIKSIKRDFMQYMTEMYGPPGTRWGFQYDSTSDMITVYFSGHEDAVIFRLTHG